MKITIGRRIMAVFAIITLIVAGLGAVAYAQLLAISFFAGDTLRSIYVVGQLEAIANETGMLTLKNVVAHDPGVRAGFEKSIQANMQEMSTLADELQRTASTDRDRELFANLNTDLLAYAVALSEVVQFSHEEKNQEAIAAKQLKLDAAFETFLKDVRAEVELNKALADASALSVERSVTRAKRSIVAVFVGVLAIALASGFYLFRVITRPLDRLVTAVDVMRQGDFTQRLALNRSDEFGDLAEGFNRMIDELTSLVGQVQKSGIQVNASATEIAATAKEQQATASEIASTTTEIGATSNEITATSKELVKTINEVARTAEQTAHTADEGRAGLARMEQTMTHVTEAVGSITGKLAVLNEKAGNINAVVTTIAQVADQTNLLSLNAAIEAEKAGEFGRGFAVVAREIRRLADQTAVASSDIGEMVKEMQSAVSTGVMGMDKFSEDIRRAVQEVRTASAQLAQIIEQVQGLTPRIETVNEGMQAQSTGASQISEALAQLSDAARQTAESLRQSTAAIQQLNEATSGLQLGVGRFKLRT